MVSIIRSPSLPIQKRKLPSLRSLSGSGESALEVAEPQKLEEEVMASAKPSSMLTSTPEEANELVEQARLAVLTQFKEEAEKARELGRQRGLQEGRLAGAEELKKEFAAELARIRSVIDGLHQASLSRLLHLEDAAVAIAFEAICKILGDNVTTREGIEVLVRQAISHAHATQPLIIYLHPADLALLRESGALDAALLPGCEVTWESDKTISLGGCRIAGDTGELDARLETQMEQLKIALLEARKQ